MIPNYERKLLYLWKKQGGRCAITGEPLTLGCVPENGKWYDLIDFHHVLPNTKVNRKLYKLYIDSVWNLMLVFHDAHITKPLPKHPPEWKIRLAEGLLAQYPGIEYMDMENALKRYSRVNMMNGEPY